eukprot:scaffold45122_cov42-Prasinocladus_malaysianus.AAC.2
MLRCIQIIYLTWSASCPDALYCLASEAKGLAGPQPGGGVDVAAVLRLGLGLGPAGRPPSAAPPA